MSAGVSTELQAFSLFVQSKLNAGENQLSPEEALDQWRDENPSEEEFEENVRAIQEALDRMNAGERGMPLEQMAQEFREMQRARVTHP